MQLLVLVPALLLTGVPAGAGRDAAAFTVAQAEPRAPRLPAENPRWMMELPTRALAASGPRIVPFAAVLPVPLSLPPAAEDRMKTVRSVFTDSAESAPRSSRAPPAA